MRATTSRSPGPRAAGSPRCSSSSAESTSPSGGIVEILGTPLDTLSDRELTRLRLTRLGFVFQRFHLLPVLTARENVELPMAEAGVARAERRARARELLAYVGLGAPRRITGRRSSPAARCSGSPSRARSPTGRRCSWPTSPPASWTRATGQEILDLFRRLNRDGTTLVVVTHDERLAAEAGRVDPHARRPHRVSRRSLLTARRSAILAAFRKLSLAGRSFLLLGFSLGVGVMVVLLSVGEAMLDQSRDVVARGRR